MNLTNTPHRTEDFNLTPLEDWQRCRPWLMAALAHIGDGTHDIEDVAAAISEQRAMLLAGQHSAMVVTVRVYPRLRELHVWLAGGDMNELKQSSEQLNELARMYACTRISISGRRGWVRALAGIGAKEMSTTIVRSVPWVQ